MFRHAPIVGQDKYVWPKGRGVIKIIQETSQSKLLF